MGIELLLHSSDLHSSEMAQTIGISLAAALPISRPQVSAGSKSESRKPRAFSTRKRSINFAKFMKRMSQVFIVWQGGARRAGLSRPILAGTNVGDTARPRLEKGEELSDCQRTYASGSLPSPASPAQRID
jgi:hypothetical protein